jgi:hypothetical protein
MFRRKNAAAGAFLGETIAGATAVVAVGEVAVGAEMEEEAVGKESETGGGVRPRLSLNRGSRWTGGLCRATAFRWTGGVGGVATIS